jgi:2-methylisocitrate lyase-like PEP mutase family enzyme
MCWPSPVAWPGTCSTTRSWHWRAAFPISVAAEAAGALKTCADAPALAALIGCATEKIIAMNDLSTLGNDQKDSINGVNAPRAGVRRPLLPPYYAIKVTGALFHTQGGLDIDARCRVLRADGTPFAEPAGGGRRGARRLGQRGLGLSLGQRPAQRGGRWRHRGGNGERNGERMNTLKTRLAQAQPLLAPGVYDALTALVAEQAGFEALYLSGASIAYTRLGRSDVGLTTFTEVQDTLARITERVAVPVIVDADTGFGNALNVQRTVRGLERAGAAMIQLEDQGFPKRCGHLDGKTVIPVGEMCGKLRAALDARHSAGTLILARTDALAVEGLDAALERADAYLACGVDALFIEALRTPDQMDAACSRFAARVPLLANMVEGGKTPVQDAGELGRRGFRIVIFSRWHGARGGAHAAGLLRQPAP